MRKRKHLKPVIQYAKAVLPDCGASSELKIQEKNQGNLYTLQKIKGNFCILIPQGLKTRLI